MGKGRIMKTLREIIVERVESVQGCKGMELVTWLVSYEPAKYDHADIFLALEELVRENKIVEVVYCLPNMDYREKSFYLPAGTKAVVLV